MKMLVFLFTLLCNLFASNQVENQLIPAKNDFNNIEKEYIYSRTVTLGMMVDNYPFSFKEDDKIDGFSYDYINLIIKKSGLKIQIQMDNWSNNFNKFKTKQIDLIDVISYKKSRAPYTNFTKPYFEIGNVVFARKGELDNYTGLESLQGKKVGIMKDVFYTDTLKNLQLFTLLEFDTSRDLMNALAYEKVDVTIDNLIVGQEFIKKSGYSTIKILEEVDKSIIKKEDLRLGIKKEDEVLFSIINKSMEAITREEKEQLYSKWFAAKIESKESIVELTDDEKKWLLQDNVVKIWVGLVPPFQNYENGKIDGISVEYIKKILKKYNIKYRFISAENFEWKQALENIRDKKEIDLLLTAKITEDRQKDMLFTNNYISSPWVIFTRNDSNFISGIEDLKGKSVSVANGYVMQKLLETNHPEINLKIINGANSIQEAIKELAVGDVDAFIGNLAIGSYITKSLYLDNIKVAAPTPFGNNENAMAVRDDWEPLVSIINKELNVISAQDKDKIYNKYLSMKYEYGISVWDVVKWVAIVSFIFLIIVIFIVRSNRKLNILIKQRDDMETKSKKFFEQSINLFLVAKGDGEIVEINDSSKRILGYLPHEMVGKIILEFVHPDDVESTINEMKRLEKGEIVTYFENRYQHKDGSYKTLAWSANSDVDKKLIYASAQDITDEKFRNQLLIKSEKLAAMGEMIGNIAHQWRQPLSVISTASTGMIMEKEFGLFDETQLIKKCNIINNNAQYLSKTIDDFRNFIKGDRTKKVFNLREDINSFLNLVEGSIKANNIHIIQDIQEDIKIDGYENELTQCFINIFNNAKDALKENTAPEDIRVIFISATTTNNKAIVKIKDNAGGIAKNIIPKVFEPYFTTKNKSLGTGLGLHMTYNLIVDGMHGTIEAKNTNFIYEGKAYTGAELTITLPIK
jgi:PAS domain S-box-containing protein